MSTDHPTHEEHPHIHAPDCEHTGIRHDDHVDYLHGGHLHHPHAGHVDEHVIEVDEQHPDGHTGLAEGHEPEHVHGADCGHDAVPHGEHTDYLVGGVLHHPHDGHCDDHGTLIVVS